MGITNVPATEISCQRCTAQLLVKNWREAKGHGWNVSSGESVELCPQCAKKQPKERTPDDWIEELKRASPEELLRATAMNYRGIKETSSLYYTSDHRAEALERGFAIAIRKCGWEHVGWTWLRNLRAKEAEAKEGG